MITDADYELMEQKIHDLENQLTQAKSEIETLTNLKCLCGILSICAGCKKIRDGNGDWTQIEAYIKDHSEAVFSHDICPECAQQLYPDFDI